VQGKDAIVNDTRRRKALAWFDEFNEAKYR
jgi:hypothetical protein